MKGYDVIVIGAGDTGLGVAFTAASEGMKVALTMYQLRAASDREES
jgi:glycerol-3-phosphate dehydrogenase